MKTDKIYNLRQDESYEDYCYRLYRNKDTYGLKHDIIGFLINDAFPEMAKDESAHRKTFAERIKAFDEGYAKALEDLRADIESNDEVSEAKGLLSLKAKTHLEKLEEFAGEYTIQQQSMRWERNELARETRDLVGAVLLAQEYSELLQQGFIQMPNYEPKPFVKQGAVLKLCPADWHIGVVVNESYNQYDAEIAWERLQRFADKAIEMARKENVSKISITHMGDIIEHIYMRNPQKHDCELKASQQLAIAQELLFQFTMIFVNEGFEVELSGVRGNHDRFEGNKNNNIDSDTAMLTIMDNIRNLVKFFNSRAENPITNLTVIETQDEYKSHRDEFFGKNFKFVHGDDESKNDRQKVTNHSRMDQINYDYLVMGHLHHFEDIQFDRNEHQVYCSTLQGANPYGKEKVKSLSNAGQTLILIQEDGTVKPINIDLQ